MKWLVAGLIIGALVGFLFGTNLLAEIPQPSDSQVIGVYFSPNGGCEETVLYWISRANSSIHVLIYSFTLDGIGDALVEAHGRGLEVEVVFEKSQISQHSEYRKLHDAGLDVRNDTNSDFMHNKVMIVDGMVVLTGSYNWSSNAENNNDENLVVIKDKAVANSFEARFQTIWDESI